MKTRTLARLGAPLALLAVCALARPASASVIVDLKVADSTGQFGTQVAVSPGQKVFFRLAAMDTFSVPLACRCDIPLLSWSVNSSLMPGRMGATTLAATVTREGTFNVTAFVLFMNPLTGRVTEVADTAVVISGSGGTGTGTGTKTGTGTGSQQQQTGGTGQQTGGTGGQTGQLSTGTGTGTGTKKDTSGGTIGELGTGTGTGTGTKKDTGTGTGSQQQQQSSGGKKDTGTGTGTGTGTIGVLL